MAMYRVRPTLRPIRRTGSMKLTARLTSAYSPNPTAPNTFGGHLEDENAAKEAEGVGYYGYYQVFFHLI